MLPCRFLKVTFLSAEQCYFIKFSTIKVSCFSFVNLLSILYCQCVQGKGSGQYNKTWAPSCGSILDVHKMSMMKSTSKQHKNMICAVRKNKIKMLLLLLTPMRRYFSHLKKDRNKLPFRKRPFSKIERLCDCFCGCSDLVMILFLKFFLLGTCV